MPPRRRYPTIASSSRKFALSEYTLEINPRKCNHDLFSFSDIEEFVRELTGTREYQFQAIKKIMIYLWGGGYTNAKELAELTWDEKPHIRERDGYESKELFMGKIPLPDILSGVIHMATGTGKGYVMFAVAYLSILMGYVKNVFVFGPSSTIIEKVLTNRFNELKENPKLQQKLPTRFKNNIVTIQNSNKEIEENTIVIENSNAIWNRDRNALGTFFSKNKDHVLVLSDEVHHVYSHLNFSETTKRLELDISDAELANKKRASDQDKERLWMKFIRSTPQIVRHIGFTGTPYNAKDIFADIIFNYSVKEATEEKYIKKIEPIIHTEMEEEFMRLSAPQRWELIYKKHLELKEKYSYKDKQTGKPQMKPITIFICEKIDAAKKKSEEFIKFLSEYKGSYTDDSVSRNQVLLVVSGPEAKETDKALEKIEEIDPQKFGGTYEFIFAVNKLSEGWDVDNVFQIVPMEQKSFASKLLISQVLGRGMRMPRKVKSMDVVQNRPFLYVQNHERFAPHIKELLDSVIECDTLLVSKPIQNKNQKRYAHHSHFFNLNYHSQEKIEKNDTLQKPPEQLNLSPYTEISGVRVVWDTQEQKTKVRRITYSVEEIIDEIVNKFRYLYDQSQSMGLDTPHLPNETEIRKKISDAMAAVNNKTGKLNDTNRRQIQLHFSQYIPKGVSRRKLSQIEGDLFPVLTSQLPLQTIRTSDLDGIKSQNAYIFLSEDYINEVDSKQNIIIDYLKQEVENRQLNQASGQVGLFGDTDEFIRLHPDYIRTFGGNYSPFLVNTSKLKTPVDISVVHHVPEKLFIYHLIDYSDWVESWIKSRDSNFYSVQYEYFKGGTDRVIRTFNPDFFITVNLNLYRNKLKSLGESTDSVDKLRADFDYLILVVEIKSDDDDDSTNKPKNEYALNHFEKVNKHMKSVGIENLPKELRSKGRQYYQFSMLTPAQYRTFFENLKTGHLINL